MTITISLETGLYNTVSGEIEWTNQGSCSSFQDLVVIDGINPEGDTLSGVLTFPINPGGSFSIPLAGQLIRFTVEDDSKIGMYGEPLIVKLFEGQIISRPNVYKTNVSFSLSLNCTSLSSLLNAILVSESEMPEEPAGQRISRLLTDYAPSFAQDLSGIQNGVTVPIETYDFVSLGSIFDKLASQTGYLWNVDFNRKIWFYVDLDKPAPVTAINDATTEIGNLEILNDASGIANVIIIKDFVARNSNKHTDNQVADGESSFYKLPLPPFSLADTEVTVTPQEGQPVHYSLVEDPLDGSDGSIWGQPGLAFLCIFNWGVRFGLSDLPPNNAIVKTVFNPEENEMVTVVTDDESIAEFARREGSSGEHQLLVSASEFKVSNINPILSLGQLILSRKAWPVISGTFDVPRTTEIGNWQPGQTLTVHSDQRKIFDEHQWVLSGYTDELPVRVWVTSVKRTFYVEKDAFVEQDQISFTNVPWE